MELREGSYNLFRLSDLIHLCASTMRQLAGPEKADGSAGEVAELAAALDRIAFDTRRIAAEKRMQAADQSAGTPAT